MLVKDDDVDELPELEFELPDEDEFVFGDGFDAFPLLTGFADDGPLASFSNDNDVVSGAGVFRFINGDVCGL